MNTPSSRDSCLLTLFSLAVALAPVTTAQASPPSPPTFAFKFGGLGPGNSQFSSPWAISTDSRSNLYVADYDHGLVKKFSSSGGFQGAVGPINAPLDAVADGNGDIFVVDLGVGYVKKFRIGVTGPILTFGSATYITAKSGIAMDPDGNILVTDTKHYTYDYCYCVKKLKSDGSGVIWQSYGNTSSPFLWPIDVAVDTNGNVFVADQGGYRIVKLDSNGNYLLTWGSSGTGDGQFKVVRGVAVDASGRVYVAEDNNDNTQGRVQVFSSTGTFLTKWGSYDTGDTTFSFPTHVAVSPDSRVVYVNDAGTAEIKVFTYNIAPVLDASKTPVLDTVLAGAGPPSGAVGTPVTSLVDIGGTLSNVTDVDASPVTGVAITAAAAASGTWYFTTNNGANWTLLGTPAVTNACLLIASSNSRVYFQPNPGFSGTVSSALTFRAWDQTYGVNGESADTSYSGGATAFSAATDTAGITVVGPPLTVTTLAATSVTGNRATLQASVNPNAASTDVTFQYSTDSGLAGATTTASQNIGSGSSAVAVSQPISGLLANTNYYFRAAGTNTAGTTQGSILSFTTLSLVANDATYNRAPGLSLKIKVADIASDTHGYALTVSSLGPSAQVATLSTDNTYIYYVGVNNNNDAFPYTVDNGHGDTATGTITVTVAVSGGTAQTITVSDGTATIKFFGIPGIQYDVQRTTSLTEPVTWTTLTTSPLDPGADGSFTFTDTSAPDGTAYYRSVQH